MTKTETTKSDEKPKGGIAETISTVLWALGIAFVLRTFIFQPFQKGRLFERELKRGDVIVFRPEGDTKNFIKRVVGLPGDQIQVKQGLLYLNGEKVPSCFCKKGWGGHRA